MEIGKKICELRKKMGWTQQRLAEELHVTDKAVSKWEQEAGVPDVENIINLARIFKVTTDYLLLENEQKITNEESDDPHYYRIIGAHTHAEFLNMLLGKNYKQYMKCVYYFDRNNLIWMIRLNDEITSYGWKNSLVFADYIAEYYVGKETERLNTHKNYPTNQTRYIFEIIEGEDEEDPSLRYYEFKGVFKLVLEKSDNNKRIWKRIDSKATINGDTYEAIDSKETHEQFVQSARDVGMDNFQGIF